MRNLFAVLKDSFREAVDGFVIYIMAALAFIVVVLAASFSFQPAEADVAFENMVKEFKVAFRQRGADKEQIGTRFKVGNVYMRTPLDVDYTVSGVTKESSEKGVGEKYSFQLKAVTGESNIGDLGSMLPKGFRLQQDNFKTVVAAWNATEIKEQAMLVEIPKVDESGKSEVPTKMPKTEIVPDGQDPEDYKNSKDGNWMILYTAKVSSNELKQANEEQMVQFLKQQFHLFGDIPEEAVTISVAKETKAPEYLFDVTVTVPANTKGWYYKSSTFFGAWQFSSQPRQIGPAVLFVKDVLVNTVGASVTLLISVVLTAFFIPNMLRKGSVDLVISKPISRWQLLLYKYIGGLTFVLLVTTMTVGGVWVAMAFRTGIWNPTFLLSIPMLVFTFGVLYALSTLIAVLTRSAIAAILITAAFMFILWGVGFTKSILDTLKVVEGVGDGIPKWVYTSVDGANTVLPRYNDLLKLNSRTLTDAYSTEAFVKINDRLEYPSWSTAILLTADYIVVFLLLAYWRFSTRDP